MFAVKPTGAKRIARRKVVRCVPIVGGNARFRSYSLFRFLRMRISVKAATAIMKANPAKANTELVVAAGRSDKTDQVVMICRPNAARRL